MALRIALVCLFTLLAGGVLASGQAPEASSLKAPAWQLAAGGRLEFEAASVRPDTSGVFKVPSFALSPDDGWPPSDGLFHADFPLLVYIEFAYKLWQAPAQRNEMLSHLPKWVASDPYEIRARSPGKPTKDQVRLMMQALLAERFGLKVHFENRDVPVLALLLVNAGKIGPRLTPHVNVCDPEKPGKNSGDGSVFPPPCLDQSFMMSPRPNHHMVWGSRNTTPALMATGFTSLGEIDRAVVDNTGLPGRYDVWIDWTPERGVPKPGSADATDFQEVTLLEALKHQLGLKLERTTAPLDVLVVDAVERASEN